MKAFSTIFHSWMTMGLNLKGIDLLVYMIVFGFSQQEEGCYYGNLETMATWTNSSKKSVYNSLKKLTEMKLINKTEIIKGSVKFCSYCINNKIFDTVENFSTHRRNFFHSTVEKITPNNKSNNKDNNIYNLQKRTNKKPKIEKEFIRPTLEEVEEFCKKRNNGVNAKQFYDYYDASYEQTGRWEDGKGEPVRCWKKKMISVWEKDKKQSKPAQQSLEDNRKAFKDMTEAEKVEYWRKIDAEIEERNNRRG